MISTPIRSMTNDEAVEALEKALSEFFEELVDRSSGHEYTYGRAREALDHLKDYIDQPPDSFSPCE